MSNKKICFITPSLKMGGMERVLSILANYATDKGYQVYIICLIEKTIAYKLDERIHVYEPKYLYKKGLLNKINTLRFLCEVLKSIKPDTILCFSEAFNPIAIIAAKLVGLPVYISDRSNPYKKLSRSKEIFRKITYPFANGMIAQTVLAREVALKKKYNNNITVIPNPLRNINDNVPKNDDSKRIITVGRLVSTKNIEELINIFSEIQNKDWELYILGDGDQKYLLQKVVERLNIGNQVKLVGAVKDVDAYLAESSIFAFTSLSEGFPNALSEAVAFPLPCVAYDCPAGPSDIVKDNVNGFLVPMHNKEMFKIQLENLMNSPTLRSRLTQDFKVHRDKYSSKKIADQFLKFIIG